MLRAVLALVAVATLCLAGVRAGAVIDYGNNDSLNQYSYVGVLYSPDATVVDSCTGGHTFGYWNCPVTLIDHVQLGLGDSYEDRIVLTTQYCADIVTAVSGKSYLVSFDYNPNANGALTMAGTDCPNNNYRVLAIDETKGNFIHATMFKFINDDFKYPSGVANGIQASGDLALLMLDYNEITPSLPKAKIANTRDFESFKKAAGITAAHNAAATVKGSDVWINSPQRRWGWAPIVTYTPTAFMVSINPNQGKSVMTMSGAPLFDPTTVSSSQTPVLVGLLSGAANANSMVSFERVDTASAWAFFAPSASVAEVGGKDASVAWHGSSSTLTNAAIAGVVGIWVMGAAIFIALIVLIVMKSRKSAGPSAYKARY